MLGLYQTITRTFGPASAAAVGSTIRKRRTRVEGREGRCAASEGERLRFVEKNERRRAEPVEGRPRASRPFAVEQGIKGIMGVRS